MTRFHIYFKLPSSQMCNAKQLPSSSHTQALGICHLPFPPSYCNSPVFRVNLVRGVATDVKILILATVGSNSVCTHILKYCFCHLERKPRLVEWLKW
jgi:hypothetical protein